MLPPDDVLSRCAARPYARSPGRNLAGTLDGLRIQICGTLAITLGELVVHEAQLGGRQGRRLWTYLVLNRARGIGRDELAGAVWGDEQPEAWDGAISALASRLRSGLRPIATVEPAFDIERGTGRYALAIPQGAFVDHERARAALHRAELAYRQLDI